MGRQSGGVCWPFIKQIWATCLKKNNFTVIRVVRGVEGGLSEHSSSSALHIPFLNDSWQGMYPGERGIERTLSTPRRPPEVILDSVGKYGKQ